MPRFHSIILVVYSVLVTCMVLFLGSRLSEETELVHQLRLHRNLVAGDRIPAFGAFDFNGRPVAIEYGPEGKLTVLSFLSSTCHFCDLTLQQLEILSRSHSLRVAAIAVDGLDAYRRGKDGFPFSFPLTEFPDKAVQGMFRVGDVPLTVVVNSSGVVESAFVGRLDAKSASTLLSLP